MHPVSSEHSISEEQYTPGGLIMYTEMHRFKIFVIFELLAISSADYLEGLGAGQKVGGHIGGIGEVGGHVEDIGADGGHIGGLGAGAGHVEGIGVGGGHVEGIGAGGGHVESIGSGHGVGGHTLPHYTYEYAVHDPLTGDEKSAHEERYGDLVKGYYTMKEADGTTRHVQYIADKYNGFNAEVIKLPPSPPPVHEEVVAVGAQEAKQEALIH